jgi:hypothetical protein
LFRRDGHPSAGSEYGLSHANRLVHALLRIVLPQSKYAPPAPRLLIALPAYLAKVRLQTQPHEGARKNMTGMASQIVRSDGVRGLYRGVSGTVRQ